MSRARLSPLLLLVAASGCIDDGVSLDDVTAALSNPIDRLETEGPASIDMASGHEARIPVSQFVQRTFTLGSDGLAHTFTIKTHNCSGDTGLLVRVLNGSNGHVATLYNDDVPTGQGGPNGTSPAKSSQVTYTRTGLTRYEVFAFSQKRSTAYCSIWWRDNSGAWTFDSAPHIGGTLVELGPLTADSFVEVRTRTNGTDTNFEDTRMVVFDAGTAGAVAGQGIRTAANASLINDNQSASDKDPRIAIASSASPDNWDEVRTFALLGKVNPPSGTATRTVETVAELVRGPLNDSIKNFAVPINGGETGSVLLTPGRYAVWIDATTNSSPGSTAITQNPTTFNGCRNEPRGQLNTLAFSMSLDRQDVGFPPPPYDNEQHRIVPLGAFGADNVNHRFALEFEVKAIGAYRLRLFRYLPNVWFGNVGHIVRNVDSTELKVASLNMFYHDPTGPKPAGVPLQATGSNFFIPEYKNASNLLATRGTIDPATGQISEPDDQAPYQWDADVVFVTENRSTSGLDAFKAEADVRGARRWAFNYGITEHVYGETPWTRDGQGAVFVSDNLWPSTYDTSIRPLASSMDNSPHCENDGRWQQCSISDSHDNGKTKRFIPARTVVRRNGTDDRPVMVMGLHLLSGDSSDEFSGRISEVRDVGDRFTELVPGAVEAKQFNKDGATSRLANGNRMILVGDWNSYAHGCGEHYWLLRHLRERFGFALDVSMATFDGQQWSYGMHNFGTNTSSNNLPTPYANRGDWQNLTGDKWVFPPQLSGPLAFPWFSRTFRGERADAGYGGDRFDMIILVGRGWASDDAVRSYLVMQDNDKFSTFAVMESYNEVLGGVNMWPIGTPTLAAGKKHYRPNHELGYRHSWECSPHIDDDCECADPFPNGLTCEMQVDTYYGRDRGDPALFTDHIPIGARLRILTTGHESDR
jgi:hypothetical protein